jgi:N-acetylmuramoyl-L-alanine amidase
MAVYQPIILTGDYVGNHARQQQAFAQQCLCVVEFHFNAGSANATGGEVYYKQGDPDSQSFADAMWAEIASTGLAANGQQPVKSSATNTRTGWIDHYAMIAILLEPLFISNRAQATWLHDNTNATNLADAIAAAIKGTFPDGGRIGLSAGHAGKTIPDPGANCVLGDHEADHTVDLRNMVSQSLTF